MPVTPGPIISAVVVLKTAISNCITPTRSVPEIILDRGITALSIAIIAVLPRRIRRLTPIHGAVGGRAGMLLAYFSLDYGEELPSSLGVTVMNWA